QKPARVPVGGDRVRAGLLLPGEPVGEESLQDGGEIGHRAASPDACSSRPAARARSSGTACIYQYVDFGSIWPSQVDRTGSRAWAWPRIVATAVGCGDAILDVPHLESRMVGVPVPRPVPPRPRRQASAWRMPVTASSPMSVRQVTARIAGARPPAAFISAAIS